MSFSTPAMRMATTIHHVRCGECNACQEYMMDPATAPRCSYAKALLSPSTATASKISTLSMRGFIERKNSRHWKHLEDGRWVLSLRGRQLLRAARRIAKHYGGPL